MLQCFVGKNSKTKTVGYVKLSNTEPVYNLYSLDSNERIVDFDVSNENNIVMLKYTLDSDNIANLTSLENKETYELIHIDFNGNIKSSFNLANSISMDDATGFCDLEIDLEGNIYIVDYNGDVWVLDEYGNYLFFIDNNDGEFIGLDRCTDGSVVVLTSENQYNYKIHVIDVDKKSYKSFSGYVENMKNVYKFTKGMESGITYLKDNALYNYSFKDNKNYKFYSLAKKEKIDTVSAITLLNDGRYFVIDSHYDNDTNTVIYSSVYLIIQ